MVSFDKSRLKILLLEGVHETAVEAFRRAGYERVERREGTLPEAELQALVADVHVLGIRSRTQLTAARPRRPPDLMADRRFCIGTNQIDLRRRAPAACPSSTRRSRTRAASPS